MVGKLKKQRFFNLPTIGCQELLFKTKRKTTSGGQIETKAFSSICPPQVVRNRVGKRNKITNGGQIKNLVFNLSTIGCSEMFLKTKKQLMVGKLKKAFSSICRQQVVRNCFSKRKRKLMVGTLKNMFFILPTIGCQELFLKTQKNN